MSIGIYATKWTGDKGFFLNEEHVKIRGFCNHESFGGVGMAIPDRVNLYRAQVRYGKNAFLFRFAKVFSSCEKGSFVKMGSGQSQQDS